MKLRKRSCVAFVLMMVFILGATPMVYAENSSDKTSVAEIKQETQDLIQALKAYTADQRDEAIQKSKSALKKLDSRIDELEARIDTNWEKMNTTARQKARDSLRALRQQRIRVAEWYGSLKNSTVSAWDHMKEGFSGAYRVLSDAWEKSEKEFGSDK